MLFGMFTPTYPVKWSSNLTCMRIFFQKTWVKKQPNQLTFEEGTEPGCSLPLTLGTSSQNPPETRWFHHQVELTRELYNFPFGCYGESLFPQRTPRKTHGESIIRFTSYHPSYGIDIYLLDGGFKYIFMFIPIWGRRTPIWLAHIFQIIGGFNHQRVNEPTMNGQFLYGKWR